MNKTARLTSTFSIVLALTVPAMKATAQVSNATLQSQIAAGSVIGSSKSLVQKLYADRGFTPIFYINGQLTQSAVDLRNAVLQIAPAHGLPSTDYWTTALEAAFTTGVDPITAQTIELQLAKIYVDLATHISVGRLNPQSISKDIKYAKRSFDSSVLAKGVSTEGISNLLQRLAPQHDLYKRELQIMARLLQIQAQGGFPALTPAKVTLKVGTNNPVVSQIKSRLIALGYQLSNTSTIFDQELLTAIQDLQANNQGETTREISPGSKLTWESLGASSEARIRQVQVSLEKLRWLPQHLETRHIFVNLATSRMYLRDPNLGWQFSMLKDMRIINGRNARKTPSMRDETKSVVLNPTWGVPTTIFREDKVPQIKEVMAQGGQWALQDWFNQKRFTVMDDSFSKYIDPLSIDWINLNAKAAGFYIVQQPGYDNALGVAKVMLTNPWSIYMHDTNERHLFQDNLRSLSSGCMRMEFPRDMAAYLLQGTQWGDRATIDAFVPNYPGETRDKETWVKISPANKIALYTLHLTANLGDDGVIRFTRDLYSQNADVLKALQSAGYYRTAR